MKTVSGRSKVSSWTVWIAFSRSWAITSGGTMQLTNAKRLRVLLLVIVGLAASVVFVQGQGTTGSLTGQVTDPSGAAIASATVTLTDVDTNYPQTVKTDSTGVYGFKLVQPGNYALSISAASF